ncbi:YlzJ-like family protein [Paenibacillus solani]|uniref:YlzJ-like protein n=1 Tax=Paenibacillus solani TaxID=1705565 RepID=A0A0M1P643_9BACL|nr:YlzJ-like family protein [Paenibacillus solani]KOR89953.1 hypothetical protein AM231_12945 [Paenibacillus solani]
MTWYSVIPMDYTGVHVGEKAAVLSKEVRVEGILMEVEPLEEDQAKIVRLLDCMLQDYLNPRYAPGAIIRYIPTMKDEA